MIRTLELELPFDRCENCALHNYRIKYEGLGRDVSWGDFNTFIDIIFVNDKGTDFDKILGGKDGNLLKDIIKEFNIENYLVTASVLCRHRTGAAPNIDDMDCCFNNIEYILQTIIKTNKNLIIQPPKLFY